MTDIDAPRSVTMRVSIGDRESPQVAVQRTIATRGRETSGRAPYGLTVAVDGHAVIVRVASDMWAGRWTGLLTHTTGDATLTLVHASTDPGDAL